ncbi:MAG: hypothetical protein WA254_19480 [Candidatus Sulfotelmatobacter sp.]
MMNASENSTRKAGHAGALIPWILIGLALGAVGGAVYARQRLDKNSKYLSQWLAISEYENLAGLEYKHADTDHAKKAQQDLLTFMDYAEANRLATDKRTLEIDRGLTYMRLALLDEKSGDLEASRAHIAAAAKTLQLDDTSEAHLRQIIAKMDSSLP